MRRTLRLGVILVAAAGLVRPIAVAALVNAGAVSCVARQMKQVPADLAYVRTPPQPVGCHPAAFAMAHELDGGNSAAIRWVAVASLMDGRPGDAVRALEGTAVRPDGRIAYLDGLAHHLEGQADEAGQRWLRVRPDGRVLSSVAARLIAAGQPERAVPYLRMVTTVHPDSQEALVALAHDLYLSNRSDEALAGYAAAWRLANSLPPELRADGLYIQAQMLAVKGEWAPAIEALRQAVALRSDQLPYMAALGSAYASVGRFQDAESWFDRILVVAPHSGSSFWYYGNYYSSRGWHEKAIDSYEQAVRFAAQPNAMFYYYLGNERAAAGQNDKALDAWREALRLDPGNRQYQASIDSLHAH